MLGNCALTETSAQTEHLSTPAHWKLALRLNGVRLAPEIAELPQLARPSDALDFASREIELILPGQISAGAAVLPPDSPPSPLLLCSRDDRLTLVHEDQGDNHAEPATIEVGVVAPPDFYRRRTRSGTPMWQVGTVHAGYLSIDPAGDCGFADRGLACQFCPLDAGALKHHQAYSREDVLEVVDAAFSEGVAEFVFFNTGWSSGPDGGFAFIEPYVELIKKHFDTLVVFQGHPPPDLSWVDRTYAAGVDALSYSLEVFDADKLEKYCQGRSQEVGRQRYLDALAHAATIFPSGTVWSDLIIGLEETSSTAEGIDTLTKMGVVPVLSVLSPLEGTALEDHSLPELTAITGLYAHLFNAVRREQINTAWMRDLGYGVTPIEARYFAGEEARLEVAASSFYHSRLGSHAVRGLSHLRRRLRVRKVGESFDSSHL